MNGNSGWLSTGHPQNSRWHGPRRSCESIQFSSPLPLAGACWGGSGRGQFQGTDLLRAPPPQPSPASGRGGKKAVRSRERSRELKRQFTDECQGGPLFRVPFRAATMIWQTGINPERLAFAGSRGDYFGWMFGSPPGVPGAGITGVHRRCHNGGVDVGRRADHAFRFGQLIAQRSAAGGFVGAWRACAGARRALVLRPRERRRNSLLFRLRLRCGDE
jgi:hypothetical protein